MVTPLRVRSGDRQDRVDSEYASTIGADRADRECPNKPSVDTLSFLGFLVGFTVIPQ